MPHGAAEQIGLELADQVDPRSAAAYPQLGQLRTGVLQRDNS